MVTEGGRTLGGITEPLGCSLSQHRSMRDDRDVCWKGKRLQSTTGGVLCRAV